MLIRYVLPKEFFVAKLCSKFELPKQLSKAMKAQNGDILPIQNNKHNIA